MFVEWGHSTAHSTQQNPAERIRTGVRRSQEFQKPFIKELYIYSLKVCHTIKTFWKSCSCFRANFSMHGFMDVLLAQKALADAHD